MINPSYVCGFAFGKEALFGPSTTREVPVLVLRKAHPEWQAGRLNGVGGKIEIGEGIRSAMVREFKEETSLVTTIDQWRTFHLEGWPSGVKVHFMHTTLPEADLNTAETVTRDWKEPCKVLLVVKTTGSIQGFRRDLMPNLRYLISMGLTLLQMPEHHRPSVS